MTIVSPEGNLPDLGPAFRLPEAVAADPDLVELYVQTVNRMRQESRGIPMHTVQEFLLERIATQYVLIRYREIHNDWVGLGVTASRDANQQWLDLVKEWNKVLASGHEKLRDAVLQEVQQAVLDGIALVRAEEDRKALRLHFQERFAAMAS